MKFSSPIRFSKKGIVLRNKKYSLVLPWTNPFKYYITEYASVDLPYKNSSKLKGLEYNDLISEWVALKHPVSHVVVLTNINVEARNIQFWAKVPKTDMIHFVKDLVVLQCKDKTEVIRLAENIPPNFADAQGYSAGILITHNKELE